MGHYLQSRLFLLSAGEAVESKVGLGAILVLLQSGRLDAFPLQDVFRRVRTVGRLDTRGNLINLLGNLSKIMLHLCSRVSVLVL